MPLRVLVDANVLLRQAAPDDPLFSVADHALRVLTARGEELCIVPQTLYEFWAVATRPGVARGGLGWAPAEADGELARLEKLFSLLPDNADIFRQWRRLVASYGVSGVNGHDARLVAAMKVHELHGILTFNGKDFRRYEAGENVAIMEPANIINASTRAP
jgi:predicted nucleic acid-binding protein